MGPIRSPETSVSDQLTSRNNPEDGRIKKQSTLSLVSKPVLSYRLKYYSVHVLAIHWHILIQVKVKVKLSRYRPNQALGWSGRLRPRVFMTFGTMKMVGRHPYAPAVFTPRSILVLIFRGWVNPRAHGSVGSLGKNPQWHHWGSIPRPSD